MALACLRAPAACSGRTFPAARPFCGLSSFLIGTEVRDGRGVWPMALWACHAGGIKAWQQRESKMVRPGESRGCYVCEPPLILPESVPYSSFLHTLSEAYLRSMSEVSCQSLRRSISSRCKGCSAPPQQHYYRNHPCFRPTLPPSPRRAALCSGSRYTGRIQPVVATPSCGGGRMGRPRGWVPARAGRPTMRSPGRPPVAGREDRQRFWVAIARGMPSEDVGIEAGVSPAVRTRWFRASGGIRPVSLAPLSGRTPGCAGRAA
jgi:hypothetical protein